MDYPHSVHSVNLLNGKFTDGNPQTGLLPSRDTASWSNAVTDELLGIIEAAGLTPTEGLNTQLLQALRRTGVFTTLAQFDNSTVAATSAFVQRALGNFSGEVGITTSQTLPAVLAGRIINAGGTITLTLPPGTTVAAGASYQINNVGVGIVTVQAGAGNNLFGIGNGTPRSFLLGSGDTITIAFVGGTSWYAWGGVQLGASAAFGSLLASNGYQKLPSGLIIQWGGVAIIPYNTTNGSITFPVSFNSQCFHVSHSCFGVYATNIGIDINLTNLTSGGFSYQASTNAASGTFSVRWIAIGN
ncbi:gp53-like domain-containing protein [Chitiniphilus eburneus]|uniref:Phage tail protein n=1 Tax=Chitiniphilus eburneus TaxID=2571148 RepID=A0A4U0QCD6_9NEIS|nr:phage tail protein [Chitiniphilus eburneus]TJZ78800.1 phage tail protein [Chitiniphilus eburneus]